MLPQIPPPEKMRRLSLSPRHKPIKVHNKHNSMAFHAAAHQWTMHIGFQSLVHVQATTLIHETVSCTTAHCTGVRQASTGSHHQIHVSAAHISHLRNGQPHTERLKFWVHELTRPSNAWWASSAFENSVQEDLSTQLTGCCGSRLNEVNRAGLHKRRISSQCTVSWLKPCATTFGFHPVGHKHQSTIHD